jgi:hypothetical protein
MFPRFGNLTASPSPTDGFFALTILRRRKEQRRKEFKMPEATSRPQPATATSTSALPSIQPGPPGTRRASSRAPHARRIHCNLTGTNHTRGGHVTRTRRRPITSRAAGARERRAESDAAPPDAATREHATHPRLARGGSRAAGSARREKTCPSGAGGCACERDHVFPARAGPAGSSIPRTRTPRDAIVVKFLDHDEQFTPVLHWHACHWHGDNVPLEKKVLVLGTPVGCFFSSSLGRILVHRMHADIQIFKWDSCKSKSSSSLLQRGKTHSSKASIPTLSLFTPYFPLRPLLLHVEKGAPTRSLGGFPSQGSQNRGKTGSHGSKKPGAK